MQGGDALATSAALTNWLVAEELLDAPVLVDDADLRFAHALRASLRAAIRSTDDPDPAPEPLVLDGLLTVSIAPGAVPALRPVGSPVRGALAQIVVDSLVAGARCTFKRLKMCSATDCRWVFYDHSRPANGRWCDPERCGNRMKTRAYRARSQRSKREERGRIVPGDEKVTHARVAPVVTGSPHPSGPS